MANVTPSKLVIRCYGYRMPAGEYVGVCVDLNIAVQAESPQMLRIKMFKAIRSYIETVLDTQDRDSIPYLLSRKAPIKDWVLYYLIKLVCFIREFPNSFFRFKEHLPFQLNHS